jgi:hypothetical protein
MSSFAHLTRRFVRSWSRSEPSSAEVDWARAALLEHEWTLWSAMAVQDRRHSLEVGRRFAALAPEAPRAAVAGALLHDVGKTVSGLGTAMRVVATLIGPRGARLRAYHDHERLGAELLDHDGSDPSTVELVRGTGPWAAALRRADDV